MSKDKSLFRSLLCENEKLCIFKAVTEVLIHIVNELLCVIYIDILFFGCHLRTNVGDIRGKKCKNVKKSSKECYLKHSMYILYSEYNICIT